MIVTKRLHLRNKYFTQTYSDSGYYIERDGIKYVDAVDPYNSDRVYIETEELIDDGTVEKSDKENE